MSLTSLGVASHRLRRKRATDSASYPCPSGTGRRQNREV